MKIAFTGWELLEIFENEPEILSEETGSYSYKSYEDNNGLRIVLNLKDSNSTGELLVTHTNLSYYLVRVAIDYIRKITTTVTPAFEKIDIFSEDEKPYVRVYFKPQFGIRFADSFEGEELDNR